MGRIQNLNSELTHQIKRQVVEIDALKHQMGSANKNQCILGHMIQDIQMSIQILVENGSQVNPIDTKTMIISY